MKPISGVRRITVTVSEDRAKQLDVAAQKIGLATPTYCRVLLSEWADTKEEQKAP